jgi:predicted HTH transcriptional regulator
VKVSQSYTKENGGKTGGKVGGDVALIEMTDIQKSIIDLIGADASISIDQMAVKLTVKKRTLEREIAKMKQKGYISRTGSPRSGKWEIIIPYNCVIEIV